MTHSERLTRARIALILDEPFFGSLLMHLKLIEDKSVPTFSTNGKNLRWNPAFLDTLDDPQLKTVLAHEVLHCALLHPFRRGDRDLKRFNVACDYAINNFLDNYNQQVASRGHTPPFPIDTLKGCLLDHKYDGQSAEEIYAGMIDPPPPPGAPSPGEFVDGACDQAGLDELEANWKVAMQQSAEAAKSQGKLPADIARLVKELVDPAVPWRETLRNFITAFAKDDYSWSRPNRRFNSSSSTFILPSLHSPRLGEIAVAIDTSGSIGEKELTIFLSEIRSILFDCHPEKLIFLQCDAKVQDYQELTDNDSIFSVDAAQFEMKGGGGTDFRKVFDKLEEEGKTPCALIYLTDTHGDFPEHEPSYPVLWASTEINPSVPFGSVVELSL